MHVHPIDGYPQLIGMTRQHIALKVGKGRMILNTAGPSVERTRHEFQRHEDIVRHVIFALHAKVDSRLKAEPRVVLRMSQHDDSDRTEPTHLFQSGTNQRRPDPLPLKLRQDRHGGQPHQQWRLRMSGKRNRREHDVADDGAVFFGDKGDDWVGLFAKRVDEIGFRRRVERGEVDGADGGVVGGLFGTDGHGRWILTDHRRGAVTRYVSFSEGFSAKSIFDNNTFTNSGRMMSSNLKFNLSSTLTCSLPKPDSFSVISVACVARKISW